MASKPGTGLVGPAGLGPPDKWRVNGEFFGAKTSGLCRLTNVWTDDVRQKSQSERDIGCQLSHELISNLIETTF